MRGSGVKSLRQLSMPSTIKVKSADAAIRKQREATAERVIDYFGNKLPNDHVLCFFDDGAWQALKDEKGLSVRGFYSPITAVRLAGWWGDVPNYLKDYLIVDGELPFDHLIYLLGSTCSTEIGLAMTFAHELQHFVQRTTARELWAANALAAATLDNI